MFKMPRAWDPSWSSCFITKLCRKAHKPRAAYEVHARPCSDILKSHEKGSKPSEPMMKWWMSGPVDMRGPWQLFSITPCGVTIFTCTTYENQKSMKNSNPTTLLKRLIDFLSHFFFYLDIICVTYIKAYMRAKCIKLANIGLSDYCVVPLVSWLSPSVWNKHEHKGFRQGV